MNEKQLQEVLKTQQQVINTIIKELVKIYKECVGNDLKYFHVPRDLANLFSHIMFMGGAIRRSYNKLDNECISLMFSDKESKRLLKQLNKMYILKNSRKSCIDNCKLCI